MPVTRSLELSIHCIFLNIDPHKGITVNMTWPFTVTFLTWKHMEVLKQMNCVFVPFDHCHLCIKPPLLTRASGINKASHHKETYHNCSMTLQYCTPSTKAPTRSPIKVHDSADPPLINQSGSGCFEGYSNRLHAADCGIWPCL